MRNWCGFVEFTAASCSAPDSLAGVQEVVAGAPRIRALGTAHSFSDIADSDTAQVSVANLPVELTIDTDRRVVRVSAGIRYGDLATELAASGWALHNFASLSHIGLAGSVATGTHGSGDRNQTLSAAVRWVQLVTAEGDVCEVAADDPRFPGMVVHLGTLGVVTALEIAIEPAYQVRQFVFDGIRRETLRTHFDEVFSSAYSVSFFTTWDERSCGQVWMKRRDGRDEPWQADDWMGGALCTTKQHPLPGHDPLHCTEQMGVPGASHDRLPHFRLDFTPSSGEELQTEYLLPRTQAPAALVELEQHAPSIAALLHISEVRTMAADDLWLSGAYGRDTVGIHFTWKKDRRALELLPLLDDLFGAHGGRAHWGKLHATPATEYARRYPKLAGFRQLRAEFDPGRKFVNGHLSWL